MDIDNIGSHSEYDASKKAAMSAPGTIAMPHAQAIKTLPPNATANDIKEAVDRDGAVIVQQVLSPNAVSRILEDVTPFLEKINPKTDYDDVIYGELLSRTKRLEGLVQKSDAVVEAILDKRSLEWAEKTLDWCGEIQLNGSLLMEIGPGEKIQSLHRDNGNYPQIFNSGHEVLINSIIALSDFTEETGATRVAVGSHKDLTIDPKALDPSIATVPAVMKAGDALYFSGRTIHGGGANTTTDVYRRGLSISFTLGWLKPEEAHTLSTTVERMNALPRRIRELCSFAGYRPHSSRKAYFTHRLEMQDPYTVLFGEQR